MNAPVETGSPENRWASGCVVAVVVGVIVMAVGGFAAWRWHETSQAEARAAAEAEAQSEFQPVYDTLDAAANASSSRPYDIDDTMRVLHQLDEAMRESPDVQQYLERMMREDYSGVAPEVLAARRDLLKVLFPLYARQTEAADQQEMWEVTSEAILAVMSVVNAPQGVAGPVTVDRQQAEDLLRKVEEQRETRRALQRDIHDLEEELLTGVLTWSGTWAKYNSEWEALCLLRDRAYLNAAAGDWKGTAEAAEAAIQKAPSEREAHLLLALAAIEGGPGTADVDVVAMLDQYMKDHPHETAPAMLLSGVAKLRAGDTSEGMRMLEESAKQYPQQAEALTDLANPYKSRAWLRRTREGTYILHLYEATMLGAGYFSPDLQLARAHFDRGETTKGREKVMDHFFRRRGQAQWGLLLDDLKFAEQFLGEDFEAIFPEETFLDLGLDKTLLGEKLALSIDNRSDRPLHNATLLLCLQVTDMHPADYEVVRVDPTQEAVPAHDTTKFGDVEVAVNVFGETKGRDAVIFDTTRAIVIANEGVLWVDTEAFKVAARTLPTPAVPSPIASTALQLASEAVRKDARLEVEPVRLLADDVVVTLPRTLVVLTPLFQLQVGDGPPISGTGALDGPHIRVRFKGVYDWEDGGSSPDLTLSALAPGGRLKLTFMGDPASGYRLGRVGTE